MKSIVFDPYFLITFSLLFLVVENIFLVRFLYRSRAQKKKPPQPMKLETVNSTPARRPEKTPSASQMAAGVAQEINNPIGVILGFAQSLRSQFPDDPSVDTALSYIEKEAYRCKELARDLLLYSRTASADQRESLEMTSCIEAALVPIEAQARLKKIWITKDLASNLPLIEANRSQIQQIVVNLCNNAIDALPEGGEIKIKARVSEGSSGRGWVLEVSDNGEGIPDSARGRIFDPFFTTKESGEGAGLGLALVQEVVQKYRGRIDVRSEPGKGATFMVTFPGIVAAAALTENKAA